MFGRWVDAIADQGSVVRASRKILKNPARAVRAGFKMFYGNWLTLALSDKQQWVSLRNELKASDYMGKRKKALMARFEGLSGATVRGHQVVSGEMPSLQLEVLYALIRARRPQVVVETGVCNGMSSAIILHALEKNGSGKLYSVDLPEFADESKNDTEFWEGKGGAAVPGNEVPGWLVDPHLRPRWELVLGKSQQVLQPLLRSVRPIDIFIHDSEHSYANQIFEFESAFEALRPGGLLLATDISWSLAFEEFWRSIKKSGARRAFVDANSAVVIKAR